MNAAWDTATQARRQRATATFMVEVGVAGVCGSLKGIAKSARLTNEEVAERSIIYGRSDTAWRSYLSVKAPFTIVKPRVTIHLLPLSFVKRRLCVLHFGHACLIRPETDIIDGQGDFNDKRVVIFD